MAAPVTLVESRTPSAPILRVVGSQGDLYTVRLMACLGCCGCCNPCDLLQAFHALHPLEVHKHEAPQAGGGGVWDARSPASLAQWGSIWAQAAAFHPAPGPAHQRTFPAWAAPTAAAAASSHASHIEAQQRTAPRAQATLGISLRQHTRRAGTVQLDAGRAGLPTMASRHVLTPASTQRFLTFFRPFQGLRMTPPAVPSEQAKSSRYSHPDFV